MAAAAVSFACYGGVAIGSGWIGTPLERAFTRVTGRQRDPQLATQRIIHRLTRGWLAISEAVGGLRVRFHHAERLARKPALIVANHPSLADSPILTSRLPEADFVVSSSWVGNSFLRRAIVEAGYLREDAGMALIRQAVERLRAGRRVVMYPEGSRTPPEGLGDFHRGIAHIALRAGCDILPVSIRVSPRILTKGQTFLDMPAEIPVYDVEVGEPWPMADYRRAGESRSEAARRLTAELREYFLKRWEGGCV